MGENKNHPGFLLSTVVHRLSPAVTTLHLDQHSELFAVSCGLCSFTPFVGFLLLYIFVFLCAVDFLHLDEHGKVP